MEHTDDATSRPHQARRLTERRRPTLWRTLQTPGGVRPGPREVQREARAYAESWHQALLAWKVDEVQLTPTERGSPASRTMVVCGIGAYTSRRGGGTGGGGVARYVWTPGRQRFTELEVGSMITAMERSALADLAELGKFLKRLREGQAMNSLVDERGGWNSPRDRATNYARAVLTLAVRLGDGVAELHLVALRQDSE